MAGDRFASFSLDDGRKIAETVRHIRSHGMGGHRYRRQVRRVGSGGSGGGGSGFPDGTGNCGCSPVSQLFGTVTSSNCAHVAHSRGVAVPEYVVTLGDPIVAGASAFEGQHTLVWTTGCVWESDTFSLECEGSGGTLTGTYKLTMTMVASTSAGQSVTAATLQLTHVSGDNTCGYTFLATFDPFDPMSGNGSQSIKATCLQFTDCRVCVKPAVTVAADCCGVRAEMPKHLFATVTAATGDFAAWLGEELVLENRTIGMGVGPAADLLGSPSDADCSAITTGIDEALSDRIYNYQYELWAHTTGTHDHSIWVSHTLLPQLSACGCDAPPTLAPGGVRLFLGCEEGASNTTKLIAHLLGFDTSFFSGRGWEASIPCNNANGSYIDLNYHIEDDTYSNSDNDPIVYNANTTQPTTPVTGRGESRINPSVSFKIVGDSTPATDSGGGTTITGTFEITVSEQGSSVDHDGDGVPEAWPCTGEAADDCGTAVWEWVVDYPVSGNWQCTCTQTASGYQWVCVNQETGTKIDGTNVIGACGDCDTYTQSIPCTGPLNSETFTGWLLVSSSCGGTCNAVPPVTTGSEGDSEETYCLPT